MSDAERAALPIMLDRLRHRGPDGGGAWQGMRAVLGHRRLSIIDLAGGWQPIANETGSVQAVVNGAFYNYRALRDGLRRLGHRFRTDCDSEVLVHLYEAQGSAAIDALCGMFAFGVWDEHNQTAWLARDRLGVKPLYFAIDDRRLVFASGLKALLAVPGVRAEIDPAALWDYFVYGYIAAPRTILKNVYKLAPGTMLTWRDGRARVECYWDLRHRGWRRATADGLAEDLWAHLQTATRDRLVADVPVGAFLSGGVDSTSVATAMSEVARGRITTTTCGFDEAGFDERNVAATTAERLGTRHHELTAQWSCDGLVDDLAEYFDEPFADASAIPMVHLCLAAREHVKVALSGDGGDEVLAGYRRYRFDRYEQAVRRRVPAVIRRGVFGGLTLVYPPGPRLPRPLRAAATLRNLAVDGARGHGLSVATARPDEALAMLRPEVARGLADHDPLAIVERHYAACDAPDHVSRCQYVDIKLGLGDGILTKVDRASMACGVEVRSPMLDYRFVERAWSIPPDARIAGRSGKAPLRRALRRRIGPDAADRRKQGFDVPLDAWFDGALGEAFEARVVRESARVAEWVDPARIAAMWKAHRSGRRRCGVWLWKLAMLEAFCARLDEWAGRSAPRPTYSGGLTACIL